jgi:carbonic anhydrase/acetyltransferase-like protein (isoleucine patch superfamily)
VPVYPYRKAWPSLGEGCWLAPDANVVGDVVLGRDCSVWFGTTIRGDVFPIRIGDGTNVQDNSVIHVTTDRHATEIGRYVTIGHRVILHGCRVEDGALIGMGAIVMDRAVIGEQAFIGAGAIVTEGTVIPPRTLAVGIPARPKRALSADELERLAWSATHYVDVARDYLEALGPGWQPR